MAAHSDDERRAAAAELPAWVMAAWDDEWTRRPPVLTQLIVPCGARVVRIVAHRPGGTAGAAPGTSGAHGPTLEQALADPALASRAARCWALGAYARVRDDYWVAGYCVGTASEEPPGMDSFRCLPVKQLAAFYDPKTGKAAAATLPQQPMDTLTAPTGVAFEFPVTDPRVVIRDWRKRRAARLRAHAPAAAEAGAAAAAAAAPAAPVIATSGADKRAGASHAAAIARARAWWTAHGRTCRSVVPHAAVPPSVSPPLLLESTTAAPWAFPRAAAVDVAALAALLRAPARTRVPWPTLPVAQAYWALGHPVGFAGQAVLRWFDRGAGLLRSDTLETELAQWLASDEAQQQRVALGAELAGAARLLGVLAQPPAAPLRLFETARPLAVAAHLCTRVLRYRLLPSLPPDTGLPWTCALTGRALVPGEPVHVWDVQWPDATSADDTIKDDAGDDDKEEEEAAAVMTVLVAAQATEWPIDTPAQAPAPARDAVAEAPPPAASKKKKKTEKSAPAAPATDAAAAQPHSPAKKRRRSAPHEEPPAASAPAVAAVASAVAAVAAVAPEVAAVTAVASPKKRRRVAPAPVPPPAPAAPVLSEPPSTYTHPALEALRLVLRVPAQAEPATRGAPDAALVADYHALLTCADPTAVLAWARTRTEAALGAMTDAVDALLAPPDPLQPPTPAAAVVVADDADDDALLEALASARAPLPPPPPPARPLPAACVFAAVPALQRLARALRNKPERRARPAGGLWTDALARAAVAALTTAPEAAPAHPVRIV